MRPAIFKLLRGCGLAVLLAPASAWAQDGHGSIVAWDPNAFGQHNVPTPNTVFVAGATAMRTAWYGVRWPAGPETAALKRNCSISSARM
jgi:hypothetical protein